MKRNNTTRTRTVRVYPIRPVFRDRRGAIFDILENKVQHVGMVTFTRKGVRRAQHYHKRSIQYTYVLSGKIELITSNIDGSKKRRFMLRPGMFSIIPPRVVHTYIAMTPSRMLDLTTESRKKNGYEADTYRVAE